MLPKSRIRSGWSGLQHDLQVGGVAAAKRLAELGQLAVGFRQIIALGRGGVRVHPTSLSGAST